MPLTNLDTIHMTMHTNEYDVQCSDVHNHVADSG